MEQAARELIQQVKADLPIIVFPEREILGKLKESYKDLNITLKSEFEIHSIDYLGDEGGIACEVRPKNLSQEDAKCDFLVSITHFRVKVGEPHFRELEKYRMKRIKRLAREHKKNRFR